LRLVPFLCHDQNAWSWTVLWPVGDLPQHERVLPALYRSLPKDNILINFLFDRLFGMTTK
jgi:hypothetical protein